VDQGSINNVAHVNEHMKRHFYRNAAHNTVLSVLLTVIRSYVIDRAKAEMDGERVPTNKLLEDLVEKSGVKKLVLDDPEQIVCDDEWTEERERLAQALLTEDESKIPEYWQSGYCDEMHGYRLGG
jgi:hypothetical protein